MRSADLINLWGQSMNRKCGHVFLNNKKTRIRAFSPHDRAPIMAVVHALVEGELWPVMSRPSTTTPDDHGLPATKAAPASSSDDWTVQGSRAGSPSHPCRKRPAHRGGSSAERRCIFSVRQTALATRGYPV